MIDRLSLELAETDFQEAVERTESLRRFRNDLVRQALTEGWTHARVAEATGMTRTRVGQIAKAADLST